ncbi:MAG TPA: hypothetical protein VKB24_11155 [Candidatus Acidoferrum sp.]|nr:hypothetical protein [Candidatus Acidoferrum sp.]
MNDGQKSGPESTVESTGAIATPDQNVGGWIAFRTCTHGRVDVHYRSFLII